MYKVNDEGQFPNDIHERTRVSRVAHYLSQLIKNDIDFIGYSVDVEYNRRGLEIKRTGEGDLLLPDLIVHKRKSEDQNNLLYVEFKNSNNSCADISRIREMTDQNGRYKYLLGCFVRFDKLDSLEWFKQ
ncbi:MAG: hypothetical protein FWE36_00355 [Erysipelotrichales bacterium]|nr:hypothetical protein [Erysipelotrichales bacterium]